MRKKGKINQEILRQNNLEYSATRDDFVIRPVVGAHYSYAYSYKCAYSEIAIFPAGFSLKLHTLLYTIYIHICIYILVYILSIQIRRSPYGSFLI